MFGSELPWISRRMQRIGEQQKAVRQLRIFGRGHARLASAIGLSGEVQRNPRGNLAQFVRGQLDTIAITVARTARGSARACLAKRQVPAQDTISSIGKRAGDG